MTVNPLPPKPSASNEQLPQGVNGYFAFKELAESGDSDAQRCFSDLKASLRSFKVPPHMWPMIGNLVVRLSYAARDGMTLDTTAPEWRENNIGDFTHWCCDIYEDWMRRTLTNPKARMIRGRRILDRH